MKSQVGNLLCRIFTVCKKTNAEGIIFTCFIYLPGAGGEKAIKVLIKRTITLRELFFTDTEGSFGCLALHPEIVWENIFIITSSHYFDLLPLLVDTSSLQREDFH